MSGRITRAWSQAAGRLARSDGAQDRVAHRPAGWAVEGDVGPQRRREAADALAAPSRRQDERLEPASDVVAPAVAEDERDAAGGLQRSVGSDPGEQQALGASRLGRRPAADEERFRAAVLVLDPDAAACAGEVGAAEPFGDHALEAALLGRGQHRLRAADEVTRRAPAQPVVEPQLEQQPTPALVRKLARGAPIEVEQVEREKRDRAALGIPARTVGRGPQPPAQARKVGTPSAPRHTSSPSSSTRWRPSAVRIGASSGNSSLPSRPGRERRHTARPSPRSWSRIPSNFTSNAQPPPTGSGPVRASIGATNRGSSSREGTAASVRWPAGVCDRRLRGLDEAPMEPTRDRPQKPACFRNPSQSGRRSAKPRTPGARPLGSR
jgi:hypothetical protein